jgi:hypothetical protein
MAGSWKNCGVGLAAAISCVAFAACGDDGESGSGAPAAPPTTLAPFEVRTVTQVVCEHIPALEGCGGEIGLDDVIDAGEAAVDAAEELWQQVEARRLPAGSADDLLRELDAVPISGGARSWWDDFVAALRRFAGRVP